VPDFTGGALSGLIKDNCIIINTGALEFRAEDTYMPEFSCGKKYL